MSAWREALADEDLMALLILADAMSGLTHELNNSLNLIALQASVIEVQGGDRVQEDAQHIRRETAKVATMLQPLTHVRQRQRQAKASVNLNTAVKEVLEVSPDLADKVKFEPAGNLPTISCHPLTLTRLLAYFLRLAVDGAENPAFLLRTEIAAGRPRLVLEHSAEVAQPLTESYQQNAELVAPESILQRLAFASLARLAEVRLDAMPDGNGVALAWNQAGGPKNST